MTYVALDHPDHLSSVKRLCRIFSLEQRLRKRSIKVREVFLGGGQVKRWKLYCGKTLVDSQPFVSELTELRDAEWIYSAVSDRESKSSLAEWPARFSHSRRKVGVKLLHTAKLYLSLGKNRVGSDKTRAFGS